MNVTKECRKFKSIINNNYNKGAKWEPWDTPEVTLLNLKFFNLTICSLFYLYEEIQESNGSQIPMLYNLDISIEWFTLSNALEKSILITSTWDLDAKASYMDSTIIVHVVIVAFKNEFNI